jgi:glutamate N-acetyltransferase/amino-acid N-acetyltransferase
VAAPVTVSRRARLGELRAVVVNSGNANVSDGERGLATAEAMVATAAAGLGLDPGTVAVASTGVIGQKLDRDAVTGGIESALEQLSGQGGVAFSDAIMTTDRWPKRASLDVELSTGVVQLSAQAKGGGMISPSFATLLCFVETDARIDQVTLKRLLQSAVAGSFERITVDGQMSTNDSVFMIAAGEGVDLAPGGDDERRFAEALHALLLQHALEITSDGEGAIRVARLTVKGSVESIEPVARAVADSPLVKTALTGADPNWGRIIQAAGGALPDATGVGIDLAIEGVQLARNSDAVAIDAETMRKVEEAMAQNEVDIEIELPDAEDTTHLYFCDFGHEYVKINSEYTT